jgi:dTDP-4-dehydrorhamnose 3,5-epimerase
MVMGVEPAALPGVKLIKPDVFRDDRGFFLETWSARRYAEAGISGPFVQDNLSSSTQGVLRGLHFQHPTAQGKLVAVLEGAVFDVAVDVRVGSPTFGRWCGVTLSGETQWQFWVPEGFAHGFCVLSERALFAYKCTAPYDRAAEQGLAWNDPDIGIAWPVAAPILSAKDAAARRLRDFDPAALPRFQG